MTSRARRMAGRERRRGRELFALGACVVVVSVLAFLGGLRVVPRSGWCFGHYGCDGSVRIAKTRVGEVSKATRQYMLENDGRCPSGVATLVAEKYLEKSNRKDPWGTDFGFTCPGTNVPDGADVVSFGPDRQAGTPDDIKSWEQ